MAKEQKGNRESKKPKKEKVKTIAAAAEPKGWHAGLAAEYRLRKEEVITGAFDQP